MSTEIGTSVNEAAQKISGILSEQEQPTESPQSPEVAANTTTEEAETLQSDTDTDTRIVRAKLDDMDIELQILTEGIDPELIPKGLMMESDYRKKTMSLAEERKAFEEKQGQLSEKITDLDSLLDLELKALNGEEGQELKEMAPEEYIKRVDAAQAKHERLKKYKAEKAESKRSKKQKKIDDNVSKWSESIPEWLDTTVRDKELSESAQMLLDSGYNQEELSEFYDYRLMGVLRDAAKFRAMKKTDLSSKKVQKPLKSSSSNAKTTGSNAREAFDKVKSKAVKSGSIKDAQEALKMML